METSKYCNIHSPLRVAVRNHSTKLHVIKDKGIEVIYYNCETQYHLADGKLLIPSLPPSHLNAQLFLFTLKVSKDFRPKRTLDDLWKNTPA